MHEMPISLGVCFWALCCVSQACVSACPGVARDVETPGGFPPPQVSQGAQVPSPVGGSQTHTPRRDSLASPLIFQTEPRRRFRDPVSETTELRLRELEEAQGSRHPCFRPHLPALGCVPVCVSLSPDSQVQLKRRVISRPDPEASPLPLLPSACPTAQDSL